MAKRRPRHKTGVKDWHLWSEVTRTVEPLPGRDGRVVQPATVPEEEPQNPKRPIRDGGALFRKAPRAPADPDAVWQPTGPDAATGRADSKARSGIEPRVHRRVRRGQVPIDGTIDLHGLTQDAARDALRRYVPARAGRGDRTLLVITGKGLKKAGYGMIAERGVLRHMLAVWLNEPGVGEYVSGWEVAARQHGGEGAFYVRLKRRAG